MSSTNNEHRANLCSPKSLGTPAVSARPLLATAAASSSRPPSFGAFLAVSRFEWDLYLAIVVPFSMAVSIAMSIDPRVTVADGVSADAADASSNWGMHRCELPDSEARAGFPCGAGMLKRVLHVFYHMAWYTLVRPARLGDWATVLSNGQLLAWCAAMGVLSTSSRSGAMWAGWRRCRSWVLLWAVYLARSSHLALAFLLLPAPTWTTHSWTRYLTTACTNPVLNTLMLGLCDQVVKLPLPFIVANTLIQSITTFILAYRVAPTILSLQHAQRNQQQEMQDVCLDPAESSSGIRLPVPLQCGVRPEHATLLSCRPLPLQLMIGLVMLVWPVWVSWHVEKGLRRQHAAQCDRWRQQQGLVRQGVDGSASGSSVGSGARLGLQSAQCSSLLQDVDSGKPAVPTIATVRMPHGLRARTGATGVAAVTAKAAGGGSAPGVATSAAAADKGSMCSKESGGSVEGSGLDGTKASTGKAALRTTLPAASTHAAGKTLTVQPLGTTTTTVQPLGTTTTCTASPRPTARLPLERYRYQALTVTKFASVKVHDHPGTFAEYSGSMVAAAPAIARAALLGSQDSPAAAGLQAQPFPSPSSSSSISSSPSSTSAPTSSSGVLPPLTVVRSAVIRGCVQLVAWARGLRPGAAGAEHGLQDGGGGEAGSRDHELQQQQLLTLMSSLPLLLPGGFGMAGVDSAGVGMGVSVQVGSEVAAAGLPIGIPPEPTASSRCGVVPEGVGNGVSHTAARLLQLSPNALAAPAAQALAGAAAAPATTTLRLLLHSPIPQPARVLVLAECAGGKEQQQACCEQQDERQHVPSRLLAEVPVELVGGTQEVEVALGAEDLTAAVEAAGDGAVGVLQLVLVGPEHNAAGEAAAERPHAYPLVHWVAPPLLLLPPAAVAELCAMWGAIRTAAGAPGGAVSSLRADTDNGTLSDEHESALWWAHLAPLLGDLAYALGGQVQGDAAAMEAVSAHLLPYLYDNGLPETAAMVQQLLAGSNVGQPLCATEGDCAPAPADNGPSFSPPTSRTPAQSTLDTLTDDTKATMRSKGPATPAPSTANDCPLPTCSNPTPAKAACVAARSTPTGGPPGAVSTTLGSSSPTPRGPLTATAAALRFLLPPAPFSPPDLELSYQAWRLAGMATAAPYVLLLTAQPFAVVALRLARERGSVELLQGIVLSFFSWATDACSSLVLLCLRARLTGTRDAYTASAVRQHYLAAVVYGPAIVLILTFTVIFRILPYYAPYVGSVRLVLMCTLHRTAVLPSVRQLSVRETWDKAPLLALGEALHVWIIQPNWPWVWIVGTAVVWRMGALVVASMWEARSRRRFSQLLQQQQQQQQPHLHLQPEQCSRGPGAGPGAVGEQACGSGLGSAGADGMALAKGNKQL